MVLLMFYDGPQPPTGIFDDFLAVPDIQVNITSGSFFEFYSSTPTRPLGTRWVSTHIPRLEEFLTSAPLEHTLAMSPS